MWVLNSQQLAVQEGWARSVTVSLAKAAPGDVKATSTKHTGHLTFPATGESWAGGGDTEAGPVERLPGLKLGQLGGRCGGASTAEDVEVASENLTS